MEAHCGARGYRVVWDGSGREAAHTERAPTADESAGRMALPSDLPGALEPAGTSPAGGAGVTTDGTFFAHDPSRADRADGVHVERRARLEYECEDEADAPTPPSERVAIPAQSVRMGSPETEGGRFDDEGPLVEVAIGAFSIDRTPVTVEAFEARLAEVRASAPDAAIFTEAETPETWPGHCNLGSTRRSHPVNCISFEAARAYCRLVGGDLPTEAERELVTRAGAATAFWWGDTFEAEHAVSSVGCGMRACRGGTVSVTITGARCNSLGVCDLAGNVWEWTLTEYAESLGQYVSTIPEGTVSTPVHRGGSWLDEDPSRFRSAFRGVAYPENGLTGVGFRCVTREPAP